MRKGWININIKKIISMLMAVLMVVSCIPMTSVGAISEEDYVAPSGMVKTGFTDHRLAPGIKEQRVTTVDSDGTNQNQSYYAVISKENFAVSKNIGILAGYDDYSKQPKWNLRTVRDQAAAAQNKIAGQGKNIVFAMNGDYFNMQTGEPLGALVMGGEVIHGTNGNPYMAVTKNGNFELREGNVPLDDVEEAIGSPLWLLKDGKVIPEYIETDTRMPRAGVGITASGDIVFFENDGRQAPKSIGYTLYEAALAMQAMGCVDALYLDGGGSATFCTKSEGTDELTVKNSPSDGVERKVSSSIFVYSTAKADGEFDHASLSPVETIYTPDSTVEFTALGVDASGGKAELPKDGKFVLAQQSADMGEITADGKFVSNGKTGTVAVNYVSGEKVCGSTTIEIQQPDELYLPSEEVSLGFEATTDFGIEAKYQNRTVIMKDGDLVWSIADTDGNDANGKFGTFDGLTFTTFDGITATAFITATSKYNGEAEKNTVKIKAVIGAMPQVIYDMEYTTDIQLAESDPSFKYIPSYNMPRFDRSIGTTSPEQAAQFYEQGYPLYCWPNGSLTDQDSMKATIVSKDDGEPVRFGNKSLRIDYDYSSYNGSSNSNNYLRVTSPSYSFEGSPTAIGAWVYVPEGTANFVLYLNCSNKNGGLSYATVTGPNGIDWNGWKYVEFDLTNDKNAGAGNQNAPFGFYQGCGVFWISYQTGGPRGDKTASHIYLDNIQLIYGANTDDTVNPLINSIKTGSNVGQEIEDGKTVLSSNTNTFYASFADAESKYATGIDYSEVKMLLDGVDVTDKCFINPNDEEIYFYDAELANGTHSIEISVADKFGNVTTETRYFKVKGENAKSSSVELVSLDAAPVIGEKYNLAVKADDASAVNSADVSVKILSNFVNYWKDFEVTPGTGYELDGEAAYNSKDDTINFKVRKTQDDVKNEDGVIANLIINIPKDVPEGLEVTYRVSKGKLELLDVVGDNFVSSFSGKITTSCVAPYSVACDTMIVGAEGGCFTVTDTEGNPVTGAKVYVDGAALEGKTGRDGTIWTETLNKEVKKFSYYAEKNGKISFTTTSQVFGEGGDASGSPTFVKLNATTNSETMKNVSWMSSPISSKAKAVIEYALKSDYDANGKDTKFTVVSGKSILKEMSSAKNFTDNYAVRVNNVTVSDLKANSEYVYRVGDGEKMSELRTFATDKANTDTNFFVIGDTQATDTTNTDNITKFLAAEEATGTKFSFGIQTGDAVDNGGDYGMWANIAKVFSGDYLGHKDLVQVLGNHEYYGDLTASNASAYFGLPGTENETAPLCYSVKYGNVYVAVINYSNISGYKQAAKWLIEDAQKSDATWKILTMHQPAYFTNPSGTSQAFTDVMAPAIDEAGIDVVFSGHDHSYARTEPLKGGNVDKDGTVYYICGSTGEKSYSVVPNESHHYVFATNDYNAIYLTVKATDDKLVISTHDLKEKTVANEETTEATAPETTQESTTAAEETTGESTTQEVALQDETPTVETTAETTAEPTTETTAAPATGTETVDEIIDSYTVTKKVDCDGNGGHSYSFDRQSGYLTCKVCSYTTKVSDNYIGFVTDKETGKLMYLFGGKPTVGWIADGTYYFDEDGLAVSGETVIDGKTYTFDENGKFVKGSFVTETVTMNDGSEKEVIRYYAEGGKYVVRWREIDGTMYFFNKQANAINPDDGDMYRGGRRKVNMPGKASDYYFVFADDGALTLGAFDDLKDASGNLEGTRYYWGEDYVKGEWKINGVTYFFDEISGFITAKDISKCNVKLSADSFVYDGSAKNPTVTVKDGDETLALKTNYTVEYKDNVNPGKATVVITGKPERGYTGSVTLTYSIATADISAATVSTVANQVYTGKNITPTLSVTYNKKALVLGTDYTVSFKNNKNTGKATAVITGKGNFAGKKTISFKIVPAAVTSAKAAPASYKSIKISWAKVSGAEGYSVYRATSKNGTYTKVKNLYGNDKTSYTQETSTGKTYYYKVRAFVTIDGAKAYGAYSSIVSAAAAPVAVKIKAASASYKTVKISWNKQSGVTGYAVYVSTSKNGKYTRIATVNGASSTSVTYKTTTGKTLYYKVRAYKTAGKTNVYGAYSNIVSAKAVPAKPAKISAKSTSSKKATISWSGVSGATGYEVFRSTKSNGTYTKVKTVSAKTKSFTNSSLKGGTKYYFKVRAYTTVGKTKVYGSYSATASVTVKK